MLKNEMESYIRIGGKGLKNLMYTYMGWGGVKNCQNRPYVINEWPLAHSLPLGGRILPSLRMILKGISHSSVVLLLDIRLFVYGSSNSGIGI